MSSDDEPNIPLQDRKPFGSGLKRKKVVFVPASSPTQSSSTQQPQQGSTKKRSVADFYLDLVLPQSLVPPSQPLPGSSPEAPAQQKAQTCEVCQLPFNRTIQESSTRLSSRMDIPRHHESSIAHQVCLTHSHPPSAIDRSRMGLAVLQSQGWDPDTQKGLGSWQQGILHPIKPKPKDDRLGIGVEVPKAFIRAAAEKKKKTKVDARGARRMAEEERRRKDRLRRHIYGNDEVEKYLGTG